MRGHEDIIRMRRNGEAPAVIHIETDDGFTRYGSGTRQPFGNDHPQVHIAQLEAPHRLDLRFVVGLTVQVNGCNAERVDAVASACTRAKASRVIGITHRHELQGDFNAFPVIRVTDTTGAMTWHE